MNKQMSKGDINCIYKEYYNINKGIAWEGNINNQI